MITENFTITLYDHKVNIPVVDLMVDYVWHKTKADKHKIHKAIIDKIKEEECNLPDSFDAYMELPYAEKIKLFKKG